ncbi:MAG: hypothetical protein EWM72_01384 [Nitrospira sp.]|nr:MAG: hypothetical protein EWM72_01384 [Nitrospira sp.]
MAPESPPASSSHRVTLFFGPEPVEREPDTQACVFNVKKRSWKAGIQVSVEIGTDQLSALRLKIRLTERLAQIFLMLAPEERPVYEGRVADLFAQAVSRCKLDLRLQSGLNQENRRILADELVPQLDQAVIARAEYVVAYVLTELDLAPDRPSPSSL